MNGLSQLRWSILGALTTVALVSSLAAILLGSQWQDAVLNLGTEMIGAVATYFVFQLIIGRRERREAESAALIRRMRSTREDISAYAIEELKHRGWLYDGRLRDADLAGFTISTFGDCEWGQFVLSGAALPGANLRRACLAGAELADCDLRGTDLGSAHLERSYLAGGDLKGAKLDGAHLDGAWLNRVNFRGAQVASEQLAQAKSLEGATLPDGTKLSVDNWEAEFEDWRERQEEGEGDE